MADGFEVSGYQNSKVNTRFSEKLEKDRKIRRGVQEIMRDLSRVKAPFHIPVILYRRKVQRRNRTLYAAIKERGKK